MAPPRQTVTDALVDLIETVTGFPCEEGTAPDEEVTQHPDCPYFVVYPLPGGHVSGPPFGNQSAFADFNYDIMAVGLRADQAGAALDRAIDAVVGLAPSGPADYAHAWPVDPPPAQRRFEGFGDVGNTPDRRLSWKSAEVVIALLD